MSSEHFLEVQKAARLLEGSRSAIAFTGAGISTRSGLPDFRSPETGLWARRDVSGVDIQVMSSHRFALDPQGFYRWYYVHDDYYLSADPNPAHFALAELEKLGYIHAIITQNVDILHQRAGSHHVIEVHGTLAQAVCIGCYKVVPSQSLLEKFLSDGRVPHCMECGGVMKPNVILTGEQLPVGALHAARQAVRQCDVMLVAGTSLSGGPATALAEMAYTHMAQLIIINNTPTPLDSVAKVVIRADVVNVLPAIVDKIQSDL